ncbi:MULTISPECIES: class I SAM-dependent methyltransferase [unclassified Granulicatella]|uniref:tRNA (adenine(22)-N(1))-methyltransferase n=1 Tax=unclassified Granulicatella TaxID=2630493 RepID=UPI00107362A7|nr:MULTISPECIES: class I SAM-dependent methyltransferase [unclassified Granulicatella]MBF0780440.1 tRNA (adenine(22)-N(1))-methyltransferase TrmK [Granulicatella sp. 19428wC4_WM01]TFU95429.1 tRNA (adenine(22)-N(1))-methyltransferase TrmK [Granulicatella sp. WM01]
MKLSKRLEMVAQCVPIGARLADIGSDHAYLPSYLAMHKRIEFAIAGEVVQGPFESAKTTVDLQCLNQYVDVRLGDGLDVVCLDDKIDTVTICGMGGELITQILERGRLAGVLQNVHTLILQPNMAESHVRKWLMAHQYRVEQEYILKENQKIYEIIVAHASINSVAYTEKEVMFGVYLPLEKSDTFIEKWTNELQKIDDVLGHLEKSSRDTTDKKAYFLRKKQSIEEMIQ